MFIIEREHWQQQLQQSIFWFWIKLLLLLLLMSSIVLSGVLYARKLKERNEQLDLKESFVTLMSHELKTPIAALKLMSENLIKRHQNQLPLKNYPERMADEIQHLQSMVDNLLALNKLRSGIETYHWQDTDLVLLISQEVNHLKQVYNFKCQLPEQPRFIIKGNPVLLLLLLRNMMVNAILYCDKDEPELIFELDEKDLRLIFIDNAKGIPAEKQQQLFDLFYQEDSALSGTGIGLHLCREIMTVHKGVIQITKSSSEGTHWRVEFNREL